MCYHNNRAPAGKRSEGLLNEHLVLRVGKGGGLIQHHNGRILQNGTGQGDALLLAAGKIGAVRAYLRVNAVRQLFQNILALGCRQGRKHLLARGLRARRAHIFQNGGLEQAVVLKHKGHLVHQDMGVYLSHIHAAHLHGARSGVPKARDQAGRGGLAAAGRAHQRHRLPRLRCEGNMGQGGQLGAVVGKAHVFEFHLVALRLLRMRGRLQRGGIHHLVDTAHSGVCQHHARGSEHDFCQRRGNDGGKHRIEGEICDKTGKAAAG